MPSSRSARRRLQLWWRHTSRRKRAAVIAAAALVWLLAHVAITAVSLSSARGALEHAKTQLEDGRVDEALASTDSAAGALGRAHALRFDPVWLLAKHLPGLATIDQLTTVAQRTTSGTLQPALRSGRDVLTGLQQARKDGTGFELIEQAVPTITRAADAAQASAQDARRISATGPFADQVTQLQRDTADLAQVLDEARPSVKALPDLLGGSRKRTYLMGFGTNAEARAHGFLGAFAEITVDRGRIEVAHVGSNTELKDAARPVVDLGKAISARYDAYGSRKEWRASTAMAHFPDVARVWKGLYPKPVDGAIAADPIALSGLLAVTGPVRLESGEEITARNVVPKVESEAYQRFADDNDARKAYLVHIAEAVLDKLQTADLDPGRLVRSLQQSAQQRSLSLWFARPAEQELVAGTQASGELPPGDHPTVFVVAQNVASNKMDYYLDRTVSYDARGCAPRRPTTLDIELANTGPTSGLPDYVAGRFNVPGPKYSEGLRVTAYLTKGTTVRRATLDGRPVAVANQPEHGLQAISVTLDIEAGHKRTIHLDLEETTKPGTPRLLLQPMVIGQSTRVASPTC